MVDTDYLRHSVESIVLDTDFCNIRHAVDTIVLDTAVSEGSIHWSTVQKGLSININIININIITNKPYSCSAHSVPLLWVHCYRPTRPCPTHHQSYFTTQFHTHSIPPNKQNHSYTQPTIHPSQYSTSWLYRNSVWAFAGWDTHDGRIGGRGDMGIPRMSNPGASALNKNAPSIEAQFVFLATEDGLFIV